MKIATIALAAGLAVLAAVSFTGTASTQQAATGNDITPALLEELRALQEKPLAIYTFDRVMGAPNAPITLIEYASMTCSHCADFHRTVMPDIERDWIRTGKAKYILRDLPWDNLAFAMGKVARCVPKTSYFDAVKALFKRQQDVVQATDANGMVAVMAEAVAPFGLSSGDVSSCVNGSADGHATIAAMRDSALGPLGVKGTPTIFVNGKKVEGSEKYAAVKAVLEQAYAAAQPAAQ